MRKIVLLICIVLLSAAFSGCGGGGSLFAPIGAKITITPSNADGALEITSSSPLIKPVIQIYQIAVKDFDNTNKGVRDTLFDITFELTSVPGTGVSDTTSLAYLCDGTTIINTLARRQTDEDGIYNLCVVYKTGAGLNYTGSLKILSGQQLVGQEIKVSTAEIELEVQPNILTIPAGSSGQFTVNGGAPGYVITSSNPAIKAVPSTLSSSGSTFTVTVPVGTPSQPTNDIKYTITDSTGKTVQATVTVAEPAKLTVLPSKATVAAGGTVKFTITGGVPGYTVYSQNPAVAAVPSTVNINGGTFNITIPSNFSESSVTLTVRDSIGGTSEDIVISVQPPPKLTVIPSSITVNSGATATFAVVGGVPGYTVVSGTGGVNPFPSHLAESGDTFSVYASSDFAGEDVTLTVIDSAWEQATATLHIKAKQDQIIVFEQKPITLKVGNTAVVIAKASSGLPVSLSSDTPTTCRITGVSEVTGLSAGTCVIRATQSGDQAYNSASEITDFPVTP